MDFDLFEKSDRDRSLDKDQLAEAGNGQENTGRWKKGEHEEFLRGMELHGKCWKKIAQLVPTRTVVQIRTHAQKYFQKLNKGRAKDDRILSTAESSVDSVFKRRIIGKSPRKKRKGSPTSTPDREVSGSSSKKRSSFRLINAPNADGRVTMGSTVSPSFAPHDRRGTSDVSVGMYSTTHHHNVPKRAAPTGGPSDLIFMPGMDLDPYIEGGDYNGAYSDLDHVVRSQESDPWQLVASYETEAQQLMTPLHDMQPSVAASKATTGMIRKSVHAAAAQMRRDASDSITSSTTTEDMSSSDEASSDSAAHITSGPLENVDGPLVPMTPLVEPPSDEEDEDTGMHGDGIGCAKDAVEDGGTLADYDDLDFLATDMIDIFNGPAGAALVT